MEQLVLYEGRPADCTGRLEKEVRTYDFLDKLGIHYWRTDHAWMKADTMEDCHVIDACLNAAVCKNLFLCNRQKTNFYLLMMPGNKPFKTKELSHQLGIARLSFASPEEMEQYLDCTPGSSSIMGLANDAENKVQLLMDEDVLQTFHLVNNYLFPGGIFIFDFNTIYKYEEVIGDTTIAENREDCSFIWENFYSCEDHINEYDVTVFERQEDDLYRRFTETHYQRGYTLEEMKTFLEKAGLIFVTALDEKTHKAPTETSERIYVIAREHGKQ